MDNNQNKLYLFALICIIILVFLSFNSYAAKVYLNDTAEYAINTLDPTKLLNLSSNLTLQSNINHSFEGQLISSSAAKYDVKYMSGNNSGFLLGLRFWGSGTGNYEIQRFNCDGSIGGDICTTANCGGNVFYLNYFNFIMLFNASSSSAGIFINGTKQGTAALCAGFNDIGMIKFAFNNSQAKFKNNIVTADNLNPSFSGNLPNIIWDEDTSTSFNISGNFSDSNNDALTYTYTNVENISISINNATGIVNLTPNTDFFGTRYAVFYANDESNVTASNNITLSVTNVNDAPIITSVSLNNSDFENRTNGTLTASWTFDDVDNATMERNEIVWRNNSYEVAELANYTTITSSYTKKNQNWSFGVRVFDGLDWSNWGNSSNITIQNSLQYFNHTLGVVQAERNQSFAYDVNYTDLDNDNIIFYDNSSSFDITSEGIINFTPANVGNITVNITISQSPELSPNVSAVLTIEVADATAPDIIAISTSNSGTNPITITLSATTDEIAICRFSTLDTSASNYSNMTQMSSTNSMSHSNAQSFNSDTSGTYYAMCNDTYGNAMNYSNSTSFNADVVEPSGGSSGSVGSGGVGASSDGKSGRECWYKWECSEWSECSNGKQTRNCEKVDVVPFYSDTGCDSRETSRECEEKKTEEPKIAEEPKKEAQIEEKPVEQETNKITGNVILSGLMGKIKASGYTIMAMLILISLFISLYFRYFRIPSSELSEEELKRLHKQLESQLKKQP